MQRVSAPTRSRRAGVPTPASARRGVLPVLSLLALLMLVLGSAAAGATAALPLPTQTQLQYGVAAGSGSLPAAGLEQLSAHHVTLVRSDAPWSAIQPQAPPSAEDFGPYDQTVQTLADQNLTWLPIADRIPRWQQTTDGKWAMPADPAAFAQFVQGLVARYGPDGTFWAGHPEVSYHPIHEVEVWNEANNPDFLQPQNSDTPGRFYDLYAAARTAVHAAAPQVKVILGGLLDSGAEDPVSWLQEMQRDRPGSLQQIDTLGWHPYLYSVPLMATQLNRLRALLVGAGAAQTPIAVTEIGYSNTSGDQDTWASTLRGFTDGLRSSDCGVNMVDPYLWQDPGGGSASPDGWYTLSLGSGQLTAAGSAFLDAAGGVQAGGVQAGGAQAGTDSDWCDPPVQPSRIKVTRVRVLAGGRLTFTLVVVHGRGTVSVNAAAGRRVVRLRTGSPGTCLRFRQRLARGRWTVKAKLAPADGWAGSSASFSIAVIRTAPSSDRSHPLRERAAHVTAIA